MVYSQKSLFNKYIAIFYILTCQLFSQNISGIVLDQNGLPLSGTNVIIEGTNLGAATDIEGIFNFPYLPKEDFTIE